MSQLQILKPNIERVELAGSRWYREVGDENQANWYASVTNILSVAQPKPLVDYYKKTSYKKQTETLEEKANLGTHIHEIIDADLQGEPISAKDLDFKPYDLTDWFKRWQKLRVEKQITAEALEIPVVHTELGFAGTCDAIGSFQGMPAVMDIKSGRYGKRAGHQMIAYKKAWEHMTGTGVKAYFDFPKMRKTGDIEIELKGEGLRLVGLSLPWNKPMNTFLYEHEDFVWTSFRAAFHLWKDFNFTQLKKMNWKYLDVNLF